MDGGKEGICAFGVACGDTAPFLKVANGVFHQVPQFIEVLVVRALLFAVFARRNLRLHFLLFCLGDDFVGIVPLVSNQVLGFQPQDQFASL
jgi:hypothetical protein